MIQEFLPGRNLNWSAVYADGTLVASAAMERLQYLLGNVAPSGVTGQVKLCATVVDERIAQISDQVVRAIDPTPHGIYSVDLRENEDGNPRVTEINPRLAGRPWLFANAGANLPLAAVRTLRGHEIGDAIEPGGLRAGVQLYRHVDIEPLLSEPT
jgi:carbamoyl-phosphate synthase large subunit